MDLAQFLPSYADYVPDPEGIFNAYPGRTMEDVVQSKLEFSELSLDPAEAPTGGLLKHQEFVRRFLSGHTPYNSILLWHDVGTGKTISSIAAAEALKGFHGSFRRALVLLRSPLFFPNFKNELEKIAPEYGSDNPDPKQRNRERNKLVSAYYDLDTFRVFSKTVQSLSDERIKELYSNRVIIVDEVHNLRSDSDETEEERKERKEEKEEEKEDVYAVLWKFLHTVENCKIILLSATPIKDSVYEFSSIMNLILPESQQFVIEREFTRRYFRDSFLNESEFAERVRGRVSYLRQTRSDLVVEQAGKPIDAFPFPVVLLEMDKFQETSYSTAWELDKNGSEKEKKSTLRIRSREAILCVDDKGRYGRDLRLDTALLKVKADPQIVLSDSAKRAAKLPILKKYSVKYHYLLKLLLERPTENVFAYCKSVSGSGTAALELILNAFGFTKAEGRSGEGTVKKSRYAVITGDTEPAKVEAILAGFNAKENRNGEYIQLLVGSSVLGEGRSLMSIRHIVILTPHWNFTDMDQAIGRGIRFGSHRFLETDQRSVTIHRLLVDAPDQSSVDLTMYGVAYRKDRQNKMLEEVVRRNAVDCMIFKRRNTYDARLDLSRECLYGPCEYECANPEAGEPIYDTYNLFYTEREFNAIREFIQSQFATSSRFSYHIQEWIENEHLGRLTSPLVFFRCLYHLVYRYAEFRSPLGFISYLKESNDTFFLSPDMLSQSDTSYEYDARIGQTLPLHDLDGYALEHLPAVIRRIRDRIGTPSAGRIADALPKSVKESILRHILETDQRGGFETFLIDHFRDLHSEGPVVGNLRLDGGRWVPLVEEDAEVAYTRLASEGIQTYGYTTDGGLILSTVAEIETANMGKNCVNYGIAELKSKIMELRPGQTNLKNEKETLCVQIKDLLVARRRLLPIELHQAMKDWKSPKKKKGLK
jgi:superfamily II DNA or RNA helicase